MDPKFKVPKAIVLAAMVHVPTAFPVTDIDPEAVAAKVLFAEDKSNAEQINNEFFKFFIVIFISK